MELQQREGEEVEQVWVLQAADIPLLGAGEGYEDTVQWVVVRFGTDCKGPKQAEEHKAEAQPPQPAGYNP